MLWSGQVIIKKKKTGLIYFHEKKRPNLFGPVLFSKKKTGLTEFYEKKDRTGLQPGPVRSFSVWSVNSTFARYDLYDNEKNAYYL